MLLDLPTGSLGDDPYLAELSTSFRSASGDLPDLKVWKLTADGSFTVKSFYNFLIDRGLRCSITPRIFKRFIPRKIAAFAWLVGERKILTLDTLFARGCNKLPTATCLLCCSDTESIDHLFFRCPLARDIWDRLASIFSFPCIPSSCSDLWDDWYRELSPRLTLSCSLIARVFLWQIWLARNNCIFNSVFIPWHALFLKICHMYISWIPVVPARDLHRLEESIAAVRRCIQFPGPPHEEMEPDRHEESSG
ncbi:uncharacterized protein LOC120271756 [Dioscorea cayenensis subsp. rotundata]|uniref:Uncharacterized protein LOC120271756 n=1 Tax=Dioscorea cayennensis subsp. rotundata TaxID=55577 RepID=A0AB40C677_DIOCR|nr:uncharacterized protein LOC120271756 [Dioscorea cayenensis subsp. rotundata]